MALVKEIENEYGIKFKYHKIRDIRINAQGGTGGTQLIITVDSYANKDTRIDNKAASSRQCVILGADFALEPFYKLLRAKFEDFNEAEDDMDNSFKNTSGAQVMRVIEQTEGGKLISQKLMETETITSCDPIAENTTEENTEEVQEE